MSTMRLTLLTDFYELTMMQGYFKTGKNPKVVFDAFYRRNPDDGGYAVCCGLEQVIDYVKRLTFTDEDIEYLRSTGTFDEDFLEYLSSTWRIFIFQAISTQSLKEPSSSRESLS